MKNKYVLIRGVIVAIIVLYLSVLLFFLIFNIINERFSIFSKTLDPRLFDKATFIELFIVICICILPPFIFFLVSERTFRK